MENEIKYITKTELKKRGFTDSIIKKLNITYDKEKINPMYKSASTMKLYDLSKIESIEKTETFKELLKKSEKRKKSSKKAVQTKLDKNLEYINSMTITFKKTIPYKTLRDKAIDNYNNWNYGRPSVVNGNRDFNTIINYDDSRIDRIIINYVRHYRSNYEDILDEIKGKVGKGDLYKSLKDKINLLVDNYIERSKKTK